MFTIVYITSVGHSGSTLLDLLLSAHSQAFSVGEIHRLRRFVQEERRCTCGAATIAACPFWASVNERLRAAGRPLETMDLASPDEAEFAAANRAMFDAVHAETGASIIVDSSKGSHRLQRLLDADIAPIVPVHLVRDPRGVVHSNQKKGRSWVRYAYYYTRIVMRTNRVLRDVNHVPVRYERLAGDPQAVVSDIMQHLDMPFEPAQLDWAAGERHHVGGNAMRRGRDSSIAIDVGWQDAMSRWQQAGVSLLTLPLRRQVAG